MYSVSRNENSFEFTAGQPFAKYSVRVDALLNVRDVIGSVPALVPTTLQTAQGSELALCFIIESVHVPPPSLSPLSSVFSIITSKYPGS